MLPVSLNTLTPFFLEVPSFVNGSFIIHGAFESHNPKNSMGLLYNAHCRL